MYSSSIHHPFVQFVDALKENPLVWQAVEHICYDYRLNQNCLLYCLWIAISEQGRLRQFHLKKFEEMISPWHHQITKMLASLNSSLEKCTSSQAKNQQDLQEAIHDNIKFSEYIEQKMLVEGLTSCKQMTRNSKQQLRDACYNLASYLKFQKINLSESDRQIVDMILRSLFQKLSHFEVADAFDQAISSHKLNQPYSQLSLNNL